jgi:hypothetical protein
MKNVRKYNEFLILEKYDDNIIAELKRLGITDQDEINMHLYHAHRGNLSNYLQGKGAKFTFGMLNALFKDAIVAKKKTEIKKGFFRILPGAIPLALAPYFPMLAVIGAVFGTSKMFHKVFDPIFNYINPQSKYSDFLKKMIDGYMKIPAGEVPLKDRFTRAFVVSDRIVEAIKPEVLEEFSEYLSDKMAKTDQDLEVPDHYVENELKKYLNKNFDIDPKIPLKLKDDHWMKKSKKK